MKYLYDNEIIDREERTQEVGIKLGNVRAGEKFSVKMEFLENMDLNENFYGHILPSLDFEGAKVSYDVTIKAPRDLKLTSFPEEF